MTRDQKTRSTTARRIGLAVAAAAVIGSVTAFATTSPSQSPQAGAAPTTTAVVELVDETEAMKSPAATAQAERLEAEQRRAYFTAVHEAEQRTAFLTAVHEAKQREAFLAAAAEAERAAAEQAAAERAAANRRSTTSGGGSMGGGWAALRNCESSGNYSAVSSSGKYRGAYQFLQSTWNSVARANYPHLVGVDPAAASPADQDAMALALYRSSGRSPWPSCGRHL